MPAELRSRSLCRCSTWPSLLPPPCHLPTSQPATQSVCVGGGHRPGQGWVGLSHILEAAAVPEPFLAARCSRGLRPSRRPLWAPHSGWRSDNPTRRTDRPADPPTPPATPPDASSPVPAQPRRPAPREHSTAAPGPLTAAAPGTRQGADAVGSAAAANAPRSTSRARTLLRRGGASCQSAGLSPPTWHHVTRGAAGSFGGGPESAVNHPRAPRPTPPSHPV